MQEEKLSRSGEHLALATQLATRHRMQLLIQLAKLDGRLLLARSSAQRRARPPRPWPWTSGRR